VHDSFVENIEHRIKEGSGWNGAAIKIHSGDEKPKECKEAL